MFNAVKRYHMPNQTEDTGVPSANTNRRRLLQALGGIGVAGVSGVSGVAVAQDEGDWDDYTVTPLQTEVGNAMKLDVAPDGRVFYSTRGSYFDSDEITGTATIVVVDPESGSATTALERDVYTGQEDGGYGIALDPNFEENRWIYFYYSPPNEEIAESEEELESLNQPEEPLEEALGEPYNQLSRFTVEGDTIDPDSEVEILRVHTQRESCCHVGGDLGFDSEGNLYLSTGDDTNPFRTNGYAPINESEPHIDAQRTAANTADLRGKILRITPQEDGSYTIPEDNLFTEGRGCGDEIEEGLVRPEIYVMGNRNPFTLHIDHETDVLYWGDYGEGSAEWSAERGSIGLVEFNRTAEPANTGWPYFAGPNLPYIDYNYETGESTGEPFDPENPVNDSPNNTGLEELPPATPATIWYPASWEAYVDAPSFVTLPNGGEIPFSNIPAGSGAPNTGPVYRVKDGFEDGALPDSYDGRHFIMDWVDGWIKTVEYDDDGQVAEVRDFLPDEEFVSPMYMDVGPDGALYLLTYGEGYNGRGGALYRIEHES